MIDLACLRIEAVIAALAGVPGQRKPDDQITYRGAHSRIVLDRGKATEYSCVDCGKPARDWSLKAETTTLAIEAGPKGSLPYSPNPWDYEPRCRSCHSKRDHDKPCLTRLGAPE